MRIRTLWWKEENWPTMKKSPKIRSNPAVNGVCDEDDVNRITVTNCLQRIGSKQITFENSFLPIKQALLLQRQVKYVEDILLQEKW